jgi:hypothetical protein
MLTTLNKTDYRSETPQAFVCPCGEENPRGMGDVRCGCGEEYNSFGQALSDSWNWDTTGKAADITPTNLNIAQAVIDGYEHLLLTGQLDREHAGPEYYGGGTEYGCGFYYSVWTAREGRDLGNGDLPAEFTDELPVLVHIEGLGLFTAEEIK